MGVLNRLFGSKAASPECVRVGAVIQQYLDNEYEADAEWIIEHLDACRDCGLEAQTYSDIKAAVSRQGRPDAATRDRLRDFANRLAEGEIDPVG